MKKKVFMWAICVSIAVLFAACKSKPVLDAEITGIDNATIYVQYNAVDNPEEVMYDTLRAKAGKFVWNPVLTTPIEMTLEVDKDRVTNRRGVVSAPLSHRLRVWIDLDEKVKLTGKYEEGFLSYTLEGSPMLEAQSQIRENAKNEYILVSKIAVEIDRLYAQGVENINEHFVDSLYEKYDAGMKNIAEKELEYVKGNISSFISGLYLLSQNSADIYLEYYSKLDNKIKNGVLGSRLEKAKQEFEKMKQMDANAAALVAGAVAPDFILSDLDGKELKLSDFSSRYIVLDFWGTWCPWCIKGLPSMKTYHSKYKNKVEFISIACRDKADKVKATIEKEGVKWIQLLNGENDKDVAFAYGVSGYPTKVILSPGLKVIGVFLGEGEDFYQTLDKEIK